MNREIKFRAWDKMTEHMLYPDNDEPSNFTSQVDGFRAGSDFDYRDLLCGRNKNLIPLQFTGLKDIAHADCYEGDIVKAVWSEDINDKLSGRAKVIFNCGCFMLEWIDDPEANMELLGLLYKTGRPRVFQILGNIYENPELLK